VAGDVLARATAALQAGCDFILVCNDPEAVDRLLDDLRWQPGRSYAQRLEWIAARGGCAEPAALRDQDAYRAALRDLDQISRT